MQAFILTGIGDIPNTGLPRDGFSAMIVPWNPLLTAFETSSNMSP